MSALLGLRAPGSGLRGLYGHRLSSSLEPQTWGSAIPFASPSRGALLFPEPGARSLEP